MFEFVIVVYKPIEFQPCHLRVIAEDEMPIFDNDIRPDVLTQACCRIERCHPEVLEVLARCCSCLGTSLASSQRVLSVVVESGDCVSSGLR